MIDDEFVYKEQPGPKRTSKEKKRKNEEIYEE
jgi:hypothetical protein